MAKKKPASSETKPAIPDTKAVVAESNAAVSETKPAKNETAPPTIEHVHLAVQAICAITGCGHYEATRRVEQMGPDKVRKIADLEQSGRRKEVIPILYR